MHCNAKTGKPFPTGARPTPRHKLLAATPHRITAGTPAQVIVVPPFLEMWLNDTYGDCVSAEEAAAIALFSVACGLPESKITDATVSAFCNAYGFLDGANLTDVMDKMISNGFQQDGGYKDGPYTGVDYSNESILQNAISVGPVKIGIDSTALPSGAGNANGWYASGGSPGQYQSEDHCVALWGYGPSAALFQALGQPIPSGFPANGYLLYTWSTIGVVDHAWIMSCCAEAWLRNPTTVGVGPGPSPTPGPGPAGSDVLTFSAPLTAGDYGIFDGGGNQVADINVTGAPVPNTPYPVDLGSAPVGSFVVGTATAAGSYTVPNVGVLNVTAPLVVGTAYSVGQLTGLSVSLPAEHFAAMETAQMNSLWGTIFAALAKLPRRPGPQGKLTIIIPPFLLVLLKLACSLAIALPAPFNAIAATLCALLPAKSGGCRG